MDSDINDNDVYQAPNILGPARFLVDFPRRDYSTDFAALIAGDEEDREAYKSGLLVLGCILGSLFGIWWMVLLVLKCKGKSVGCASGRSFRGERVESYRRDDSAGSTDMEDEWVSGEETSRGEPDFADEVSFHSSIKSSEVQGSVISEEGNESRSEYTIVSRPTTRERRTQVAFFLFGLLTLASVPLVLTVAFSPFKRAVDDSENYLVQSTTILSQVDNALNTIQIAVDTAERVVTDVPSMVSELCPTRSFEEIEQVYNIDLYYTASILTSEYQRLRDSIGTRLSDVISNKNDFEDVLAIVEKAHHETEKYLWAVPGLMLALTSVTAALLFGVLLAWKRQSSRQAQRTLSYGVLPCLFCLSCICWIMGIASALSVALLSDACTQGDSNGTPNAVVERILQFQGFERNTTTFEVVVDFTSGCDAAKSPTSHIDDVEADVQQVIDDIWFYILSVDAVGREELMNICGSDTLADVLTDAQDIARLLTSIRRSLASISSSLQCEDIYPIFSGVVEDSVCMDLTTSFSWSMFIFLLLGISTMSMVTLRASWRHKVEDQIYNEDEVAENMFLDEHEEYLHYISKYKHEWEEYGGIDTVIPVTPRHRRSMYDEASESEDTTGSRTYSDGVEPIDDELEEEEDQKDREQMNYIGNYSSQLDAFNPYQSTAPASPSTDASEDISFLSLQSLQSRTTQSRGENSDGDIEIVPSGDSGKKIARMYSPISLLKGASAIFRGAERNAGEKQDAVEISMVGEFRKSRSALENPSVFQASSDSGRDDSSFVSLTKIRTSTSEGGTFFKRGWRSRTNIDQIIKDANSLPAMSPSRDPSASNSILGELGHPGTHPPSARSSSEYSL